MRRKIALTPLKISSMTENYKINALMVRNILIKKWFYILGMLLSIILVISGINIRTTENFVVLKKLNMPDGKIYIEYNSNSEIKSEVVDKSNIVGKNTYVKTDIEVKAFIIIFGLVLLLGIGALFNTTCKESVYVEMKWEHYQLRNVWIHTISDSNGCELWYVFDNHIIYRTYYLLHNTYSILDYLNEYRTTNGEGFKKFNY